MNRNYECEDGHHLGPRLLGYWSKPFCCTGAFSRGDNSSAKRKRRVNLWIVEAAAEHIVWYTAFRNAVK